MHSPLLTAHKCLFHHRSCAGVHSYLLAPGLADFWALSDLADLQRERHAVLPGLLRELETKLAVLPGAQP